MITNVIFSEESEIVATKSESKFNRALYPLILSRFNKTAKKKIIFSTAEVVVKKKVSIFKTLDARFSCERHFSMLFLAFEFLKSSRGKSLPSVSHPQITFEKNTDSRLSKCKLRAVK